MGLRFGWILSLILASGVAQAKTSADIRASQAVVTVQGPAGDLNAPKLFAAMNTTAASRGSVFNKELRFKSSDNEMLFDLSCNISKAVANHGACTLTVAQSSYVTFDPLKKNFIFMIAGPDAWNIARNFGPPDAEGSVFTTEDGSFSLRVDDAGTETESFRVWFVTTAIGAGS